jgi:hypothetical protein
MPPREVRLCTAVEVACMLGWDLISDEPRIEVGAPLPTDLVTRPADAPSPRSRRARRRGGDAS